VQLKLDLRNATKNARLVTGALLRVKSRKIQTNGRVVWLNSWSYGKHAFQSMKMRALDVVKYNGRRKTAALKIVNKSRIGSQAPLTSPEQHHLKLKN